MTGCAHGRLLAGPEEEDLLSQRTGHAHLRGRPRLRRRGLDRQAMRRHGTRGEIAGPEEASRLQAQDRPGRKEESLEGGSRRAPCGNLTPEARVPAANLRGFGERLHGFADAQAPGMDSKKRSLGASEGDEFLRAAWRVMVAAATEPERLVFVDEVGTNASLTTQYAWSRRATGCENVTLLASMSVRGMERAWRSKAQRPRRCSKPIWSGSWRPRSVRGR